jgi:glycosyltransferase involved in cell wall biosynthesis
MGGSHKSLLSIMNALKHHEHDILLASPGESTFMTAANESGIQTNQFYMPDFMDTRITLGKKRLFNVFATFYDIFVLLIASLSLLRLIMRTKPDIVHANQMLISIASGLACTLTGTPCVWHIRENPSPYVPKFIVKIYGLLGHLLSDKIVVNSKYTAGLFKHTLAYRKMQVIPIGIEPVEQASQAMNEQKPTKLISIFGRVMHLKGHHILIEALSLLKQEAFDFKLHIYGHYQDDDPYYLSLLDQVKTHGLFTRVEFFGFTRDISTAYRNSSIVVTSSVEAETFGRTVVEAMAHVKPIIATNVGAHAEIVESGVSGKIVDPNDPAALSYAIKELLADDKLAKQIGHNGYKRYTENFTMDIYCYKLENLYSELLSSK